MGSAARLSPVPGRENIVLKKNGAWEPITAHDRLYIEAIEEVMRR